MGTTDCPGQEQLGADRPRAAPEGNTDGIASAPPLQPSAKRVLLVLDYFYPHVGGGETLFLEFARGLVARGCQVTVLTLREPGNRREEAWEGIRIVRVTTPPIARRYWFILLAILPALRLAAASDIVHAGGYASAWAARVAGWRRRLPTVLTVYEVFGDQWLALNQTPHLLGILLGLYERATLTLAFDRYLCISRFTQDRLARFTRVPLASTAVVYPAVDYDFWRPDAHAARALKAELGLGEQTFLYTYFGRPGPSKGVEFLIEAAALLRDRLPNSHLLLLLSRDPPRGYQAMIERIRSAKLAATVTVLDPVPRHELPSYLLGSDCVVVPSLSEGFGYSAVEAASLGCRIVATRGHAVEEVLGRYGVFVAPCEPRALAEALLTMAESRPAAACLPPTFTIDKQVAETLAIYEQLFRNFGRVRC